MRPSLHLGDALLHLLGRHQIEPAELVVGAEIAPGGACGFDLPARIGHAAFSLCFFCRKTRASRSGHRFSDRSCSKRTCPPPSSTCRALRKSFFNRSVHEVAPELIGATLLFGGVGGIIVEVEAYHHTDPAAHSYGGQTERNAVMFGPPGYAYVYRSYGIHWCVNFVCERAGLGERRADPRARADRGPGRDAPPPRHRRTRGCSAPARAA